MKHFISLLLCVFGFLYGGSTFAQGNSSPAYRGPLDASVSVPATYRGQNYKITGDRLGGSGLVDTPSWQSVMLHGNVTDHSVRTTGNAGLSLSFPSFGMEYHQGTSTGLIGQSNGLAGLGAYMTFSNIDWHIVLPSGGMDFGTEAVSGDSRFLASHRVGGQNALLDDEFVTLGQLLDSLTPNPGTPTVTVVSSIGLVEPIFVTNEFGIVRWTNTTGSTVPAGLHIKVSYSTAYTTIAVPVISPYVATSLSIKMSIANPSLPSFDVEFGEDMPAGSSIGFTYHVKGK